MPDPNPTRPAWEGHRRRLRQRMEREGWDALPPHQKLELVLNYAMPRQDLSDVSRALVEAFGSLGGVFAASRDRLLAVEGMTSLLAEWLEITGDVMRAYLDLCEERSLTLSCCREVLQFLHPRLPDAAFPGLWAIYADFGFNLITYSDFGAPEDFCGPEMARRLLMEAVENGVRYVYLARFTRNTPLALPDGDLARLEAVAETLRAADIDLVDCVLTDGRDFLSLRVSGRLNPDPKDAGGHALFERYARQT